MIFARQQDLSEYLCSQVISLLGKLTPLFESLPHFLPLGLELLLKTLVYPKLAPLASENCFELISEMNA